MAAFCSSQMTWHHCGRTAITLVRAQGSQQCSTIFLQNALIKPGAGLLFGYIRYCSVCSLCISFTLPKMLVQTSWPVLMCRICVERRQHEGFADENPFHTLANLQVCWQIVSTLSQSLLTPPVTSPKMPTRWTPANSTCTSSAKLGSKNNKHMASHFAQRSARPLGLFGGAVLTTFLQSKAASARARLTCSPWSFPSQLAMWQLSTWKNDCRPCALDDIFRLAAKLGWIWMNAMLKCLATKTLSTFSSLQLCRSARFLLYLQDTYLKYLRCHNTASEA